jgi:ubiquinone/menaquinone biosynthesis C-methylase UbiE
MENNYPDRHSSSPEYRERFVGVGGRSLIIRQSRALKQLLTKEKHVLDVGGGHFQVVPLLLDLNCSVVVLGSSEDGNYYLKSVSQYQGVEFRVGDFLQLPFIDKSIEQVISIRQLCHMDNWEQFLGELCRIAKEEVIFDFPVKNSFNFISKIFFGFKKNIEKNTRPFTVFSNSEISEVLDKHGFIIEQTERVHFLPAALFRINSLSIFVDRLEDILSSIGVNSWFGSPALVRATRVGSRLS